MSHSSVLGSAGSMSFSSEFRGPSGRELQGSLEVTLGQATEPLHTCRADQTCQTVLLTCIVSRRPAKPALTDGAYRLTRVRIR